MNIQGHSFVATQVIGRLNKYVAAGSHLNDIVPFIPSSVFSFEEIHESPEILLEFLIKNYPEKQDLARAMMTHSVKFGADKFNRDIDKWLLKGDEDLENEIKKKISWCSGIVDNEALRVRVHNYLWTGVDLHLIKTNLDFTSDLAKAHSEVDLKEIAQVLSECFRKDNESVVKNLELLFGELDEDSLTSVEGLAKFWRRFLGGLNQGDFINEQRAIEVFEFIYQRFEGEWEGILDKVIEDVKSRCTW